MKDKITKDELIVIQSMRIEIMTRALKLVSDWDLPRVDSYDGKRKVSYEVAHGSNGARDYVKTVAREALEYTPNH